MTKVNEWNRYISEGKESYVDNCKRLPYEDNRKKGIKCPKHKTTTLKCRGNKKQYSHLEDRATSPDSCKCPPPQGCCSLRMCAVTDMCTENRQSHCETSNANRKCLWHTCWITDPKLPNQLINTILSLPRTSLFEKFRVLNAGDTRPTEVIGPTHRLHGTMPSISPRN